MWFATGWFVKLLQRMIKQVSNNRIRTKRTGWRWLAGSFLGLLSMATSAQTPAEPLLKRCGTVELERLLQQRNPNRLRQVTELNQRIRQVQSTAKLLRLSADETVYRIPIVVHVVHNTASETIGGANNHNISDEQIRSQIEVLNEDYRRKPGTNGYNTSLIGADAGIEFYLATTDPNGQLSNGITRHYYQKKSSFGVSDDDLHLLSQIAYWPSDRYLNIWVTTLQNNYLAYTQFPSAADTLAGLDPTTNELIDGSVVDYRVFGRQPSTPYSSLYLLGRTVTHEIGHWLGLYHPDGDATCGDDFVADTPPTDDLNQTASCRDLFSNCAGKRTRELVENYLMYSPDACMNMFTAGQVARMRAVLMLSPRRARLIQSTASPLPEAEQLTINVFPNPATTDPSVDVQLKGTQSFEVDLFDAAGHQVRTTTYTNSPSTRVPLSVRGLSSGVYIVRVKTDSETVSKRLLVQ